MLLGSGGDGGTMLEDETSDELVDADEDQTESPTKVSRISRRLIF